VAVETVAPLYLGVLAVVATVAQVRELPPLVTRTPAPVVVAVMTMGHLALAVPVLLLFVCLKQ
jgi:hypothetical protein